MCTTGVLVVFVPAFSFSSTWWLFFQGMVGSAWTPPLPLGVWVYGLLSFAHGYWLLTRGGEPALPPVEPEQGRLRRRYLLFLGSALLVVAVAFGGLANWLSAPPPAAELGPKFAATAGDGAAIRAGYHLTSVEWANSQWQCDQAFSHHMLEDLCLASSNAEAKSEGDKQQGADQARILVCTLLLGLAIALLMSQGWLYRFYLSAASERWGAGGFWVLLLNGMRGVFTTVVLLVVILAFKNVVVGALPAVQEAAAAPIGGPHQALLGLLAVLVTLAAGMGLGSSWGAFAMGFLVLQLFQVPPHWGLTQLLILLATFCNQRSPRAGNVLNVLGDEHTTGSAVQAVWSATSVTLPLAGRRLAVRAQWVQWALLGLGMAVAMGQPGA